MTSSNAPELTIACLCGEVQVRLSGDPLACFYCHCDDCQAVHGAAYLPAALYRIERTALVAGAPLVWRRKTTARATCRRCGTRVWAEPRGFPARSFSAYLLPPGLFRPTFHMRCQYALLPVRDDLPHFAGEPPLFGGSDARVDW